MNKTKKKLLMYSSLAMLGISSLTGCGEKNNEFNYVTEKNGTIKLYGKIDYETLCNFDILELNFEEKTNVYIAEKSSGVAYHKNVYTDIRTDKYLCEYDSLYKTVSISCNDFKITSMRDFLIENNMIKDYYMEDDINKIIELYRSNKKIKELVK